MPSRRSWGDAALALTALATDPLGLRGAVLRGGAGPARDAWLHAFLRTLPVVAPIRRAPPGTSPDRLIGGLDLTAALAHRRPDVARGVLAEVHDGVLIVPMAERLAPAMAALIVSALDTGETRVEREGLSRRFDTRFTVIAFDESEEDEPGPPDALLDRLAFHIDLPPRPPASDEFRAAGPFPASSSPGSVRVSGEAVEAVCAAAQAFGVGSARGALLALRAARSLASADRAPEVLEHHLTAACRLVLAPRATVQPLADPERAAPARSDVPSDQGAESSEPETDAPRDIEVSGSLPDRVLAAVATSLPPRLLSPGTESRRRARQPRAPGRPGGGRRGTERGPAVGTRA